MDKNIKISTAILDALDDGIYITNQDLVVEYMNKAMIAEFGAGIGKKCHELVNKKGEKCPWCRSDEVFEGKRISREVFIPLVDKTYYLTEIPIENEDGTTSHLSIYRDVTESKKREERLRASEEEFTNLFEHVACGVFISSKEGKFLNANRALLDMLGYDSKEEFLNIDIANDLYVGPQDRQKFKKLIERHGRVIDYEVEFKRKDGSTVPVLLTGHVRYDQEGNVIGYEGLNIDISRRKLMERQLKEAHDFINKIIQSSPNAIMAADINGNILIWNRAAEETLGYTANSVIGKMNIDRIYPDGTARKVMQMVRSPEHGGVGRLNAYPMVYVRHDGTVVEGNLSAAMIYGADGKEIATVGSFVDLKERLEMERALRRTQEQLLQSEKLAAMGRLTSQIAHELNNPLYGIMNTLELLKTEISPESKRRKVLEMALSETVRLSDMLRKMLSFSKPDQQERQAVDLNMATDEILLLHEKQLQENNIKIKTSFAEGIPEINASKDQLRQVFLNLVANARDAMPEGGTLSVTTAADDEYVRIEIADTGIGIKEEDTKKIFDSFFTTKDSVKGVGLGLSVCYGFIKDHGGDIQVTSELGSGTTFTITFPISQKSSEIEEAHPE
ncbi:MAG: PAS domain S-box protein [Desulfobacterales bacterium]|jgi:two-component system NtrC family sensor kinase